MQAAPITSPFQDSPPPHSCQSLSSGLPSLTGRCENVSCLFHLRAGPGPDSHLSPALINTGLSIKDYTAKSPKAGPGVGTHPWEILATWTLGMLYSLPETSDSTVHQSPSLQKERRGPLSEGSRPRNGSCRIYRDPPDWIPPEFPRHPCTRQVPLGW